MYTRTFDRTDRFLYERARYTRIGYAILVFTAWIIYDIHAYYYFTSMRMCLQHGEPRKFAHIIISEATHAIVYGGVWFRVIIQHDIRNNNDSGVRLGGRTKTICLRQPEHPTSVLMLLSISPHEYFWKNVTYFRNHFVCFFSINQKLIQYTRFRKNAPSVAYYIK